MNAAEKTKYRRTKKWKEFRLKILKERNYTCEVCGITKKKGMHIHHINESAYGEEEPEDVAVLCPSCHKHTIERLLKRREFDIEKYCTQMMKIYKRSKK